MAAFAADLNALAHAHCETAPQSASPPPEPLRAIPEP